MIAFGIASFSLLILIASGAWDWALRDGLGPDSIESSGIEAWQRFISATWPTAVLCFALFGVAFIVAPRQSLRRDKKP
jgi:hypothetical protein